MSLPECKCGCGLEVEKKSQKYFPGHYQEFRKTGKPVVVEVEVKIVEQPLSKPIVPVVKTKVQKERRVSNKKIRLSREQKRKLYLKNLSKTKSCAYLVR